MLSGNGRHRRPRQAPALLVAAGVTGSAIAIPLLAATGASAAEGSTWDHVAECETGGSWSANTGNGYYGGLHLSQADWEEYGGLDYASRADLASRSQQIAVAEKILADQGVGVWSTCGLLSGLSQDSASADVDTGVADDSSHGKSNSSASSNSHGLSDSSEESSGEASADSSAEPSGETSSSDASADTTDTTDNSTKSDTNSDSGSDSGSGASNSQGAGSSPADEVTGDDSGNSEQSVGSSNLVDTGALGTGRHRGGSADEGASDTGATASSTGRHASSADAADGSYVVRVGDSLVSIADSLGLDGGWRALYEENKETIGTDPSRIVPGQTLEVGA
ncbi:transglycosylase family protein [Streptomyces sp. NPDC002928]|uniref:transglycosylase family protein n=1 Tax=Streptomyces sp. NPDC002928 TaxID=3154440 RepID=UPI0033AC1618